MMLSTVRESEDPGCLVFCNCFFPQKNQLPQLNTNAKILTKQKKNTYFFTYVMRTLIKSEGEVAVELSLVSIERTRSSGKDSKRLESPASFSGDLFCLFRLRIETLGVSEHILVGSTGIGTTRG